MAPYNPDGSAASLDPCNKDPLRGTKYDFKRDLVGYGRKSHNPQWPNGAKIAVSFVINYEEVILPLALCLLDLTMYVRARDQREPF
jgi:hypothetical protein